MKILFYIILGTLFLSIKGQSDTIYILKHDTVYVENEKDAEYNLFLQRTETNTNHLWKVNLTDIALSRLNFCYEHGVGENLSIDSYLLFAIGETRNLEFASVSGKSSRIGNPEMTFELNFKYYYNLNRRERLGKNTNGFRGNALAISLRHHINEPDNSLVSGHIKSLDFGLRYSIQRRFAKVVYSELLIGAYYRWSEIYDGPSSAGLTYSDYLLLTLGIRLGLAFDSLKELKYMLPY